MVSPVCFMTTGGLDTEEKMMKFNGSRNDGKMCQVRVPGFSVIIVSYEWQKTFLQGLCQSTALQASLSGTSVSDN